MMPEANSWLDSALIAALSGGLVSVWWNLWVMGRRERKTLTLRLI